MSKPESEPSRKIKRLRGQIDRGLARIARDPNYREQMDQAIRERLQELNSIEKLKPLQYEDSPIAPELIRSIATIITERVTEGSLNPTGLKKILSDPNKLSSLMQEGTARLLQEPRKIIIENN